VHSVQTGFQRYDNVKITLNINDPTVAQQCIPPGHLVGQRQGVFYSPITDATTYDIVACRFDQSQGYFRCDQGLLLWNLRGRAYFGRVQCDKTPCDEQVYYINEPITIDPFEVFLQGQKQCLFMQLYNGQNQPLLGQNNKGLYKTLEPDPDNPSRQVTKDLNGQRLLNEIKPEHFGRTPATIDISGIRFDIIDTVETIVSKNTYIEFKDKDNNGEPEEWRIEGGNWQPYVENREEVVAGR